MRFPNKTVTLSMVLLLSALLACKKKEAEETPPVPAATATPTPTAANTDTGLAGGFSIASASNPGGGTYSGDVDVTKTGQGYKLTWRLKSGESYGGVGLEKGDVLGVGWGKANFGVVVYTIDGGKLDGEWLTDTDPGVGTETLSGPAGLNGSYTITSAKTSKGSTYAGTVNISPAGDTYKLTWRLKSGETYSGVGLKEGNVLVVGWGPAGVGVVAYKKQGSTLDGRWGQVGSSKVGTEKLEKR